MPHSISIRKRYFTVIFVTTVVLFSISVFVNVYFHKTNTQLLVSSRSQVDIANTSHELSKHLIESTRLLNIYLIDPEDIYRLEFFSVLNKAEQLLIQIKKSEWIVSNNLSEVSNHLHTLLKRLSLVSVKLMNIRNNSRQMYPAVQIAETSMFQTHLNFSHAIDSAILDTTQTDTLNTEIYYAFLSVRDKWQRLIMSYRIYLVNQMGEMPVADALSQVHNIEIYLSEINLELNNTITELKNHPQMGFIASDNIDVMKLNFNNWWRDFKRVKRIAQENKWRADVPIILNEVHPIVDEIYAQLYQLNKALNNISVNYLDSQYKNSDNVYNYLWLLIIIFIVVSSILFSFIDYSLLKPISLISKKLQLRKISELSLIDAKVNNSEMSNFVSALNEMQHQVHSRQTELEYIALHDDLTNFPNRNLLLDRVNEAIKFSQRNRSRFALFVLDLDKFKDVNDTLGHSVGDDLLCAVSTRISNVLRKTDTFARLGGDEFAILLTELQDNTIEEISKKINSTLEYEFKIQGHNLYISSSIGVATYPEQGEDTDTLMRHADIAMYSSKKTNAEFTLYDSDDKPYVNRISLASELRHALSNEQFYIEFQPVYNLDSELFAFESIINWMHPKYGVLQAEQFFHEVLQIGFSKKINLWLIDNVIRSMVDLQSKNKNINIIINLMTWDLQDIGLVDFITDCLDDYGVSNHNLHIALSENAILKDSIYVRNTLKKLSENKINIILKDFGSSFNIMSSLPDYAIQSIKLERKITEIIDHDDSNQIIVKCICELAHNMGIKVIAEEVNSFDSFETLSELGCDYVVGNYFSQSVQLSTAVSMLNSQALESNITAVKGNA